ncbi:hypothetical protein KH5H1_26240 [Corallococcus caeni]|uniref:hypothetical protein n=1 Tax=Corallococcus caeni TaxID=3082388 RepID=UPI0029562D00|nr:hypothetical protein KH5H1_26240 [Corallococcus sp. KH5-1]
MLFLDEPLASLDIQHQFEFMRQIQTLSRAKDLVTVGVVHDLSLADIKETFGIEPRILRLDDDSTLLAIS